MKLLKFIFGLLLFSALPAFADFTTVTAIVTDADSFVWTNANVTMTFVPNPSFPNYNQYTLNGHNLATYQPYNSLLTQSVQTNASTGSFTLIGLDNTQIQPQGSTWIFTIKSNSSAPATVYQLFQLQGSSMNLTSFLSSNSVAPRFPAQPGVYGYGDIELTTVPFPGGQYFNTTTLVPRFWNGIVWNNYGSGGATGVTSINAATGPATFTGAVNCTGTITITCAFTGGAASFTLNLAELGALTTGSVLTHTGHYSVPQMQTLSQVNTLLASAPDASFEFQATSPTCYLSTCDTSAFIPFTNTSFRAHIQHNGHQFMTNTINIDEGGVVCDARQMFMTFGTGSNVITPSLNTLSNLDVGKVIWTWNPTTQQAFESQVTSQNGSTFTVASTPPWNQVSAAKFYIGTDNTTNAQAALTYFGTKTNWQGVSYSAPGLLTLSAGGCMSHKLNPMGASWRGAGNLTTWIGAPGEDNFATDDAFTAGGQVQGGVHIDGAGIAIGDGVNAAKAWSLIDDAGTHSKVANYRPSYVMTRASNYELAPEWCKGNSFNNGGCIVSVGTTSNTTLLCLPNTLLASQIPAVGNFVAFPYTSSGLIVTTVASVAGSCAGGFTPRTLGTTIPTAVQGEFYISQVSGGFQNTSADFPANPTYPFTLHLTNPIAPTPASEIGFAPYGTFIIGNQICTYYGVNYVSNNPYFIVTGCANTSVDHPSTSPIVALNPFNTSMPMPVQPSINAGDTTPVNASFFPGQNVGACAFAFPQSNGSANQAIAWSNSVIENLFISNQAIPSYQNTCEFYFVGQPYATHFQNIRDTGTYFGIVYGVPSTENHNWILVQPTSDATTWNNISINAGYPIEVNDANQNSYNNIDVYSNLASPSGAYVGCATGYYFTLQWDDQTGATGGMSLSDNRNLYVEPESGTHCGQEFLNEFDGNNNTYTDFHQGGGGYNVISGFDNHWVGGNLNNDSGGFGNVAPIINYGNGSSFLWTEGIGSSPFCNTFNYGVVTYNCTFINWGPKVHMMARTDRIGPYGNVAYGNNRTTFDGQTMETFTDGKVGSDFFVHSGAGYIDPSEFDGRNFDPASFTQLWTFDSTAFISQSFAACNIGTTVGTIYCEASVFNHNHIGIGPGQRLAAGKYLVFISAKSLNQSSNPIAFGIGHIVLATGVRTGITGPINTTLTNAYPTTNAGTWQTVVDLSAYGANPATDGIAIEVYAATGSLADNVAVQYVSFTPLPDNLSTQQLTIQGSGTPTATTPNGSESWGTAAPGATCGTTFSNGSIWHNSAGNHGALTLTYVCNAATTAWVGVF